MPSPAKLTGMTKRSGAKISFMSCSPQFSQSSFAATDIAKHLEEGETDEDTQNREVKS